MDLFNFIKKRALNPDTHIDMDIGVNDLPPVLSTNEIELFEEQLSYKLPYLLKQLFLEVGNGGFGHGYGLFPLMDNTEENMLAFNKDFLACEFSFWKPSHIPLVHWACGIYTFMDLAQPQTNLQVFDGNNYDEENPEFTGVFEIPHTLDSFLQAWLMM